MICILKKSTPCETTAKDYEIFVCTLFRRGVDIMRHDDVELMVMDLVLGTQ